MGTTLHGRAPHGFCGTHQSSTRLRVGPEIDPAKLKPLELCRHFHPPENLNPVEVNNTDRRKIISSPLNPKTSKIMAVHHVTFTIPERDLGNSDVEFDVKKDGSKVGKLKVSKGTVVWVPKDHIYGYKIGWADFADLMKQHGTKEE